jgi:hypothetical protein
LEIELNSCENGPLDESSAGFDPTQSLLALRSLTSCIALLLTSSRRRMFALQQLKNKSNSDGYDDIKELRSALPSQFDTADEFQVSLHILQRSDSMCNHHLVSTPEIHSYPLIP